MQKMLRARLLWRLVEHNLAFFILSSILYSIILTAMLMPRSNASYPDDYISVYIRGAVLVLISFVVTYIMTEATYHFNNKRLQEFLPLENKALYLYNIKNKIGAYTSYIVTFPIITTMAIVHAFQIESKPFFTHILINLILINHAFFFIKLSEKLSEKTFPLPWLCLRFVFRIGSKVIEKIMGGNSSGGCFSILLSLLAMILACGLIVIGLGFYCQNALAQLLIFLILPHAGAILAHTPQGSHLLQWFITIYSSIVCIISTRHVWELISQPYTIQEQAEFNEWIAIQSGKTQEDNFPPDLEEMSKNNIPDKTDFSSYNESFDLQTDLIERSTANTLQATCVRKYIGLESAPRDFKYLSIRCLTANPWLLYVTAIFAFYAITHLLLPFIIYTFLFAVFASLFFSFNILTQTLEFTQATSYSKMGLPFRSLPIIKYYQKHLWKQYIPGDILFSIFFTYGTIQTTPWVTATFFILLLILRLEIVPICYIYSFDKIVSKQFLEIFPLIQLFGYIFTLMVFIVVFLSNESKKFDHSLGALFIISTVWGICLIPKYIWMFYSLRKHGEFSKSSVDK